jgi:hypothetical protein
VHHDLGGAIDILNIDFFIRNALFAEKRRHGSRYGVKWYRS